MKKIFLPGVALAATGLCAFGCFGAVEIRPGAVEVVIPRKSLSVVRFAAEEMTNFLSRAFGAPVPIRYAIDPSKCAIVLGSNVWSRAAGIDTAKLPRDGFALKTKGNALYIAGRDGNPKTVFRADSYFERATLFGVYEFLERCVGCRFYFPGELGEIVPRVAAVAVPDLDETCAPAWTERSISSSAGSWYDASANGAEAFRKENFRLRLETRILPSCHGQYRSKIVKRFGASHPEYCRMNEKGVRETVDSEIPHVHDAQLCYTSAVWEEIYRDAKSYLSGEGPEVRGIICGKKPPYRIAWGKQAACGIYYDIMPNDGMRRCYCPVCSAVFAKAKDPADYANEVVWGKTAELARRLKAEGVGGYLTQMAYSCYRNVPDIPLPDNVIVTVCNNGGWVLGEQGERNFALVRAWHEKVGKVKLYNNTGKFRSGGTNIPDVPSTTPFAVSAFYNRVSPYVRGAYFCGPSDRFLHTAMNYYCFSRIAWRGEADIPAVLAEHYRLMYGPAAETMKAFFDAIERKWMTEVVGNVVETPIGTVHITPNEFRIRTELYGEKAVAPLAALLDKATASVPAGSLEARRIALVRQEYTDPLLRAAREYVAGLSVGAEKARRATKPPKSIVGDFRPTTVTVGAYDPQHPVKAVKFPVKLKGGTTYRLSYFVRGEKVEPVAKRGGANVVVWFDESADRATVCPTAGLTGTFDWVHQSCEFRIPRMYGEKTHSLDVRLIHATGKAEFDGLVLEKITP